MWKSNWHRANATQFISYTIPFPELQYKWLWLRLICDFPVLSLLITNFIIHCIDVAVSSAPFELTKKLEYIIELPLLNMLYFESSIYLFCWLTECG